MTSPLPKVGQTVTGANWEYTVTAVDGPTELVLGKYIEPVKPVGRWVVVHLALKNIAKQNYPINNHDFELRDGAGIKYNHSDKMGALMYARENGLQALGARLPPGVPVKTAVVFDVAPDAKGLGLWLVQESVLIDLGQ